MNDGDALSLLDELEVSVSRPSADLLSRLEAKGFATRRDDGGDGFFAAIGDTGKSVALLLPAADGPRHEDLATFLVAAARVAIRCRHMARFTIARMNADADAPTESDRMPGNPDVAVIACAAGADQVVVGGAGRLRASLRWEERDHADVAPVLAARDTQFRETVIEESQAFDVGRTLRRDRLEATLSTPRFSRADGIAWQDVEVTLRLPPSFSPFLAENWLREAAPEAEFTLHESIPAWGARGCGGLERAIAGVIRTQGRIPRFTRRTLEPGTAAAIARMECPVIGYGPAVGAAEMLRAIRTLEAGLEKVIGTRDP